LETIRKLYLPLNHQARAERDSSRSIADSTTPETIRFILRVEHSAERVRAAAEVGPARMASLFMFTARAENTYSGDVILMTQLVRLQASRSRARVLYAPGLSTEEIAAVRSSLYRPVNVLASPLLTLAILSILESNA